MLFRFGRIAVFLLILLAACQGTDKGGRWSLIPQEPSRHALTRSPSYSVLFYNTENLFDPIDADGVNDDAFTPEGRYEWTRDRYRQKLDRIAETIGVFAEAPDLVGLCEIENTRVLQDLCEQSPLARKGYGILHHQSRDPRGIDLALLFDPKAFQPYDKKAYPLENPGSGTPTRPILSIGVKTADADSLRIFLCHWPSRAGGKEASEADRLKASDLLQKKLSRLYEEHPYRKVLIMGDLNDHPSDTSVRSLLEAESGYRFRDLLEQAHQEGKGTYNYQGEWGVLDHFILNRAIRKGKGLQYRSGSARILKKKELLYYDKNGKHYQPNRFMEKGHYYGGYSDHLPILMELKDPG